MHCGEIAALRVLIAMLARVFVQREEGKMRWNEGEKRVHGCQRSSSDRGDASAPPGRYCSTHCCRVLVSAQGDPTGARFIACFKQRDNQRILATGLGNGACSRDLGGLITTSLSCRQ